MAIMPPNSTAAPLPRYNSPYPRVYVAPTYPADGTPVKPIPGRLHGGEAYQHKAMEIPDYQDGFAPTLHPDIADPPGTPDPIRTMRREPPVFTYEPTRSEHRGLDFLKRLSVETAQSTGWDIQQYQDAVPFDPARQPMPGSNPPSRPTAHMGQNTYLHLRGDFPERPPFRTGAHFSMADHKRRYLIMGQRPQDRMGVNTYRQEPTPWDSTLTSAPIDANQATVRASSLSGNRTYRASGGRL
jgi:hypothetical protein